MRWLKWILFSVGALAALGYGIIFSAKNVETVQLDLVFYTLPTMNVAWLVMLTLVLGLLLGLMLGAISLIKAFGIQVKANREVATLQKKFNQLQDNG